MQRHGKSGQAALSLAVASVLAAAILALACTFPGHAQTAAEQRFEMPSPVADALNKAGLSNITNLRQRGPNFTMNARTKTGALAKVVVNSSTGAILGFRIIDPYELNPDAARLK